MAVQMEKEKMQKLIVIGCCTIMLCAAYYYLVIDAIQNKEATELKTKVGELQNRLQKANDNEKKYSILTANCKQDEPFLAAQEAKLMKGDRVAWLWTEMGDFAEKQKMSRLSVTPENTSQNGLSENESYELAGAGLALSCGYHRLGDFLQNLENSYSTLQVQNIEILGGNSSSSDSLSVRLQLQLLALRDPKPTEVENATKIAQVRVKKE